MSIRDLMGQRFGMLTVIGHDGSDGWVCLCDCGGSSTPSGGNLKAGKTRSCGCGQRAPGRSRSHPGKPTWLSQLWQEYTNGAKRRGYGFDLTIDQVEIICKQNCFYCGSPPALREKSLVWGGMIVNGIDRKDNSQGYTVENCVPCCSICNVMKMALSAEVFVSHAKKIANHDQR